MGLAVRGFKKQDFRGFCLSEVLFGVYIVHLMLRNFILLKNMNKTTEGRAVPVQFVDVFG